MNWPNKKRFAFTIIDDTDGANIENIKPVYDLLLKLGIFTTKTAWVYKPRDSIGMSLSEENYRSFLYNLQEKGFEIALHNVGSGSFIRQEIEEGLDIFSKEFGHYPYLQINHSLNPDNLYWGYKRHTFPVREIMKLLSRRQEFYGDDENSVFFWGDLCKKHIKFIRNHCYNGINTISYDYRMPYRVKEKEGYSNYWFSSSDGHTVEEFCALLTSKNIDSLERQGGACIIYTHFASGFVKNGKLNDEFIKQMHYLAQKDGWFVPAGTLLDYLLANHKDDYATYSYLLRLDMLWLVDRIIKRIQFNR